MSQAARPNIVLLFTDQQRRDTIAAAGARWMNTPNLDRLVNEGTWFENGYSPNPVCIPARHCLLTGHNCQAHGYYANASGPMRYPNMPTYSQLLSDAGYYVGGIGKQHFLPANRSHGFDELQLMEELPKHLVNDAYATYLDQQGLGHLRNIHGVRPAIYHQPQTAQMAIEHHGTTWVGRQSVDFIRRNADRPFYLMASFIHPHPPWDIPAERQGMYAAADIPAAAPRSRNLPFYAEETPRYGDGDSAQQQRVEREAYCTAVSMVDEAIGNIINELEAQGLWENTIIVFASDHGEMLQDKGFYQKALPYESASGIPFIVRAPQHLQPGTRRRECVDLIDLMPTFLDIAGVDYSRYDDNGRFELAGSSLLRLDQPGGRDRTRQWVHFGTGRSRWLMQRDDRYKYIYWYNGGLEECYDLQEDPQELINLAGTDQQPDSFVALRAACFANEKQHGPAQDRDAYGFPVVYELEPFRDAHWEGSKYPSWSNRQFQLFGKLPPAQEGEQFIAEAQHAMDGEENLKQVMSTPDLDDVLKESYGHLAGEDGPPLWR